MASQPFSMYCLRTRPTRIKRRKEAPQNRLDMKPVIHAYGCGTLATVLLLMGGLAPEDALAQGCVVARGAGMPTEHFGSSSLFEDDAGRDSMLSFTTAYRSLHSGRHFVGTQEQKERQAEGSQVINHSDFLDLGFTYS